MVLQRPRVTFIRKRRRHSIKKTTLESLCPALEMISARVTPPQTQPINSWTISTSVNLLWTRQMPCSNFNAWGSYHRRTWTKRDVRNDRGYFVCFLISLIHQQGLWVECILWLHLVPSFFFLWILPRFPFVFCFSVVFCASRLDLFKLSNHFIIPHLQ